MPKTVLVVDDEAEFVASLVDGLDACANEFRVVTATNGSTALKVLAAEPIDLVVTDLNMPVMDGFELLAHMTEAYPSTPVLVMTAYNSQRIETRLAELEVFRLCEKPIDLASLIEAIRDGLRRAAAGHIEGVALASFLELLHMERKSCTLMLRSGEQTGQLTLAEGELTHATTGGVTGEKAAIAILGWREATIELRGPARGARRSVKTPLRQLLMDAAVAADERAEETRKTNKKVTKAVKAAAEPAWMVDGDSEAEALGQLETGLGGFVAASVIDRETGATLHARSVHTDLAVSDVGSTVAKMLKTERQAAAKLAVGAPLEDMLVSATDRLVLITLLDATRAVCLVADAGATNVALARAAMERCAAALRR
jgi:CheY-like chemotaxis protein